jgi:hypothetical protein
LYFVVEPNGQITNATSVCHWCFKEYIKIMRRFWKIAACLAGGLALSAGLRAASSSPISTANRSPENPYATTAVRNIFGLSPPAPPPAVDTNALLEAGLPKITPTGIMTVFGQSQVLFKVTPAGKSGPSAKEEYYTLSEGQRQDDIEVEKIDEKKSIVTFNNGGFTQELPLSDAPTAGGAQASSSPGVGNRGMMPGVPRGGGNGGPGGFTQFGAGFGGNNGGMGNGAPGFNNNAPAGDGANGGADSSGSLQNHIYQPEAPTMSPEDSQAMLVINHLKAQTAGDPTANLYPPTPHDQEAGINSNSQ